MSRKCIEASPKNHRRLRCNRGFDRQHSSKAVSKGGASSFYRYAGTNTAYLENDPVTGEPLILRTSSGNADLYVYSGTGNPVALLTDFSTETYAYEYDPYGVPIISAGGNGIALQQNPFLFAGGIQDRATGWIKFGARWYNPTNGRWTQQDTLDNPLDPKNANRYAYAGNDPINNIDPTGRNCTGDIIFGAAGVVGTAIATGALVGSAVPGPGTAAGAGAGAGVGLVAGALNAFGFALGAAGAVYGVGSAIDSCS